jgi:FeS assembly SUF system regulator
MLRITKESDYAILLLSVLAVDPPGAIHRAREVADRAGLPLPMVGKILRSLARRGVLTSHRGVAGGYSLDRPATQTSVAEVIRAIEGPIGIVQCGIEPGMCGQEPVCPTRVNWARISREIERALERIPVSDMCRAGGPRGPLRVVDTGRPSVGRAG